MPATQLMRGVLLGVSAVSLRPLAFDGSTPDPASPLLWLPGITEVQVETIVEQGGRTVVAVDGVGVTDVIEEDDTLVGIDLMITAVPLHLNTLATVVGGKTQQVGGLVSGWSTPSISDQRSQLKRYETDVYVASLGVSGEVEGYLRHRLEFCRGIVRGFSHSLNGVARPALHIKGRPHPSTKRVSSLDFVGSIPSS